MIFKGLVRCIMKSGEKLAHFWKSKRGVSFFPPILFSTRVSWTPKHVPYDQVTLLPIREKNQPFHVMWDLWGKALLWMNLFNPLPQIEWNHVICWDVSNITHRCELLICSEQTLIFSDFSCPNFSLQLVRSKGRRRKKNRSFT